jgi:hypothetical protein
VNVANKWTTQIKFNGEVLLVIKYEYTRDDSGDIEVETKFAGLGLNSPVRSRVLSASNAASTKTIYEALFKTWGDLNLYMYAASIDATAKTGDVSAGALWSDLTINIQAGRAKMQSQDSGDDIYIQPKFALELTQTRFLASHVSGGNSTRGLETAGACRPGITATNWKNTKPLVNINTLIEEGVKTMNITQIQDLTNLVYAFNVSINRKNENLQKQVMAQINRLYPKLAMSFTSWREEPQYASLREAGIAGGNTSTNAEGGGGLPLGNRQRRARRAQRPMLPGGSQTYTEVGDSAGGLTGQTPNPGNLTGGNGSGVGNNNKETNEEVTSKLFGPRNKRAKPNPADPFTTNRNMLTELIQNAIKSNKERNELTKRINKIKKELLETNPLRNNFKYTTSEIQQAIESIKKTMTSSSMNGVVGNNNNPPTTGIEEERSNESISPVKVM